MSTKFNRATMLEFRKNILELTHTPRTRSYLLDIKKLKYVYKLSLRKQWIDPLPYTTFTFIINEVKI